MKDETNNISKFKNRLPLHKAPETVWESVEEKFQQQEKSSQNLKRAIAGLPSYPAPENVWGAINKRIGKRIGFVVSASLVLKIAAVLILMLALGFLIRDWKSEKQSKKFAMVEKPVDFETKNDLKQSPLKREDLAKTNVMHNELEGSKRRTIKQNEIKVSGWEAIEKTGLIHMPSITINSLCENGKIGKANLPENRMKAETKTEAKNTIKRVKLTVHNDPLAPTIDKRQFTFSFFQPEKYPQSKKDTIQRNAKPLFAASINL